MKNTIKIAKYAIWPIYLVVVSVVAAWLRIGRTTTKLAEKNLATAINEKVA